MNQKILLSLFGLFFIFNTSCKKLTDEDVSTSDSPSNAVEVAMSEAGANATASETTGSVGFSVQQTQNYVDPEDSVHPFAACTYSSVRSSCSSNSDTITWGGCTVASGAVKLTGGWTETFSGTGASSCTIPVANGGSVTRTSSGSTMTFTLGATLTTDTNGGTAWDGTVIPSTGTTVANSSGTRTITINGVHRKLTGPNGKDWFDHYVKSTGLTVTGTRAGGNRVITGDVTVYHNLAKYNAVNTFNNVTWGSSSCCYPTSGTITSVFSGSTAGNTTLSFSNTCGNATFTDTSGATSNLTLTQCN